jgi:hypothetical protein
MRTTNDFADDGGDKTRFSDDAIGADMPRERLPILCNDQATVLLRADWPQVSGPLSKATKEAAIQFGQKTRLEAVKVARRHKRAPQEILIHGNLGIRGSPLGSEPPRKFQIWYTANHPRRSDSAWLFLLFPHRLMRVSCQ